MSRSMGGLLLLLGLLGALPHAYGVVVKAGSESAWRDYARQAGERKPAKRFPFDACFRKAASAHGVPLTLLLAVARGESDFDAHARSSAEALGLMQIQWPGTAHHLGIARRERLFDPCRNVDAGARYLRELIDRYDGSLHLALAAYNYGPGRISPDPERMPEGARWYSGYILRHLRYVLGEGRGMAPPDSGSYASERHLEIIRFTRPYRALAFIEALSARTPSLRLDLFRQPAAGVFLVVLLYADGEELKQSRRQLKTLGFGDIE